MNQPPPPGVNALAWKLSNAAERQQILAAQPVPGPTLRDTVAGTQPNPVWDHQLAEIADDAYAATQPYIPTPPGPKEDKPPLPPYQQDLAARGWVRLQADGDHLVDSNGNNPVAIDPTLLSNQASGFQAGVYRNHQGQYVVAFAGTDPGQLGDDKTDVGQGLGVPTTQYSLAKALARQVQGVAGRGNVAFTGHSLGGGLAATAALATGETAVTFNAAGPSNNTIRDATGQNPNDVRQAYTTNGLVRSYSVEGDLLTTLDQGAAPNQLGSMWYTQITQPGVSINNPQDLVTLHGGGGANQNYVDGLYSTIRPGFVPNPFVNEGLDTITIISSGLFPANPTDRNTVLNLLGNVASATKAQLLDAEQVAAQAQKDVAAAQREPDAFTPIRVDGALANAAVDLAGRTVKNNLDLVGNEVTALTDGGGADIRAWGRKLNFDPAAVDRVASGYENAGNTVRNGLAIAGRGISAGADRAGDAAAWVANKLADVPKAIASTVVQANRWVQQQEVRAAAAVRDAAVDTERWAVTQGVHAAVAVNDAAVGAEHWAVTQGVHAAIAVNDATVGAQHWAVTQGVHAAIAVNDAAVGAEHWAVTQGVHAAIAVNDAAVGAEHWAVTQVAQGAGWAFQQAQNAENGLRAAGNWAQDRVDDAKRFFGGLV